MKKLTTKAQSEKSLTMKNNSYHNMSKEPQSTLGATRCQICKDGIRVIVKHDCNHLSAPEQALLELLQDFEELFDLTLGS